MTEKLFTGTLNHNQNKTNKKQNIQMEMINDVSSGMNPLLLLEQGPGVGPLNLEMGFDDKGQQLYLYQFPSESFALQCRLSLCRFQILGIP